ncbi:parallel beta-helix repeat protein [Diaporthe helianthi]|uniref:Parallel beta-helix repeat protein n=1 Tax=Diaporthe helianthi TaxID=158607 RepID=A0A2P5HJ87_DIAHE|nr:parallel beta-helix repeat protein [Diaporthe helianthi]
MSRFSKFAAASVLATTAYAQCGSAPDATVDGAEGSYTATVGGSEVYSGSDYHAAIVGALGAISSGQTLSVLASGNIGSNTISIDSGKTFEGCGTITASIANGKGAIESLNTTDVSIPYLSLAGEVYFGLHFYGTTGLTLGEIDMQLTAGIGIRFDRDEAANSNVTMGTITVTGASSHAVETWNIDGLTIGSIIAKDVGECGLLLQKTTNAQVGLVQGDNAGAGTGYATLRFANQNGMLGDGNYNTNVVIDRVVSTGGGRGIFCVSESGGAEIGTVELSNNENNAILIENCYNVAIKGGVVHGGGEVRLSAREEFAVTRDISLTVEVDGNSVRESPCSDNPSFSITGDATLNVC